MYNYGRLENYSKTTNTNFEDVVKTTLRGKFRALNALKFFSSCSEIQLTNKNIVFT